MFGVGLLGAVIIGAFAGWIASLVLNRHHGLLVNLCVGVIGSFIGAFLVRKLHIQIAPGIVSSLIVSTVGAILLLGVLGLFRKRD